MVRKNPESMIKIAEFGAAEQVPGSNLLLTVGNEHYQIDTGTEYFRSEKKKKWGYNAGLLVKSAHDLKIKNVLFTHAHADHIGDFFEFLDSCSQQQRKSLKVYSTHMTRDIARLQFQQAWRGRSDNFSQELDTAMELFQSDDGMPGFPYEKQIKLDERVKITFFEAGHIPGSAQILCEIKQPGKSKPITLLTAFDLGRTDYKVLGHKVADIPILKYPHKDFPKKIDYIVIEATYGDKVHHNLEDSIAILEESANDAAKHNGKLIIPAFSIMRTHMLWNFLYRLNEKGKLPEDMVFYSSSPTANDVGSIILKHSENFDEMAAKEFASKQYNPFHFDSLVHLKSAAEGRSIWMNPPPGPWAAIAASGMCEGGRIEDILRTTLDDSKNILLITGYQAEGTRGKEIWDKKDLKNQEISFTKYDLETKEKTKTFVPLRANVRRMHGLSGHADVREIIEHLKYLHNPENGEQFKGIYIKHGEKNACHSLRGAIIGAGFNPDTVHVMKKAKGYTLAK
ncbi:MAG: MBL fold metallo-hydrolase [archaeon]